MPDPKDPTKIVAKEGEQLASFGHLRDDGTTSCGNWIFSGSFTQAGNIMARRDTADPSGLGLTPGWGFSWPANRRVLYNRASCDPAGQALGPEAQARLVDGDEVGGERRARHARPTRSPRRRSRRSS